MVLDILITNQDLTPYLANEIGLCIGLVALYFGCAHDFRKLESRIESNKEKLEKFKDGLDGIYDRVYVLEATIAEMKGEQDEPRTNP